MKIQLHCAAVALSLAFLMGSCTSSKTTLAYFDDLPQHSEGEIPQGDYSIRIIPDDELAITVTSSVPEATAVYNIPTSNIATRGSLETNYAPRQQTYVVDKDGDIMFPVFGKLHVSGMTTRELSDYLYQRVSADVADAYVRVDLMSFRVSVLGEVNKPGAINVGRERFSILDALAAAGDLTEYGERSNVLLIREENGHKTYHRLNLNDSKVLSSPYFYLKQNDAIYVEPNAIRVDNSKYNQNNAYKLSLASAIISACSVIASLVIALAVK